MLNNPLRYTDSSGYSVDCGLGESGCSNKPTYMPQGESKPPKEEDNSGEDGDNSDGDDEIVMGPPKLEEDLSSLLNVPSSVTLHPSNTILGDKNTFGGYVPVYSNGVLVGYRVARYSSDLSTIRIDLQAINPSKYLKMSIDNIVAGQLLKTVELVGSKTMFSIATRLSVASNVYDFVSIANEVIVFDGNIEIDPVMMYPQNIVSFPDPSVYFDIPIP